MIYFTADTHLDHTNIMRYCDRVQFMLLQEAKALALAKKSGDRVAEKAVYISQETVGRMNNGILANINKDVMAQDTLYILGDFAWVKTRERAKYFRDAINCKNVILIWGNHDNQQLLSGLFQGYYDILDKKINGQYIVMCHYPLFTWNRSHYGSFSCFGHVHNKLRSKSGTFSVDVGIDGWDYKPVSFDQVVDYMKQKDVNGEQGYEWL